MKMVDFYAELHLNQQDSIAELNQTLTQLESTWKRREITNPEKATTMLALIIQARRAFASESSRREYDRELARSKEKPIERDPNAEREQQFKKWYEDARSYYDGKQYDLAKTAVEKALSYYDQASDNDAFLSLTANVYSENQSYTVALDYINKAIIISPDDAMHYISKAFIYRKMASSGQRYNNLSEGQLIQNACNALIQAVEIAQRQNDKNAESAAYGLLAYYHYFVPVPNRDKAEEYANKSVALGDVWGNASEVLKDIKQKRQQEAKAAEEQRRRDEEQRRLQEQRIRLQKQEEERRIRLQKQEEERRAEEEKRQKNKAAIYRVIFILSFVYLAYVTISTLNYAKYHGNFDSWIEFAWIKLMIAFLAVGVSYGLNAEKGFDIGVHPGFWLIALPVTYTVVYTFILVKHIHDEFGAIVFPIIFVSIYFLVFALVWIANKIFSLFHK